MRGKTQVAVVGVGQTKLERRKQETLGEIVAEASRAALDDAGLGPEDIDAVYIGIACDVWHGAHAPDRLLIDDTGLAGKPTMRIATSGSTGLTAAIMGKAQIAAGLAERVLVIGAEKMSDTHSVQKVFNSVYDEVFVRPAGINVAIQVGLEMRRFMEKYGISERECAMVSVKNHRNAVVNPYAQLGMPDLTVEEVLESEPLALPLRLLHLSGISDGACAMVLARDGAAQELHKRPVWFQGEGHWTDSVWFMSRRNMELGFLSYVRKSAEMAYEQAGIRNPAAEIDVAEVVDPQTFKEMMICEAIGLCDEGGSGRFVSEGHPERDGSMPVNPSGGLLGEGNAIGAQPALRLAWAVRHIRGESGEVFPHDAHRAVVAEWGGMYQYGATVVVGDEKPVAA